MGRYDDDDGRANVYDGQAEAGSLQFFKAFWSNLQLKYRRGALALTFNVLSVKQRPIGVAIVLDDWKSGAPS